MFKHHTKNKGDLGVLKVKLDLFNKGFLVLNPETEHSPFDIVGYKDGKFTRFQVKYRSMCKGTCTLTGNTSWADKNGSHTKRYDFSDIDKFAVYVPEFDLCFYVDSELFIEKHRTLTFRFSPPKNNQSKYWLIHDFLEM